MSQGKLSCDTEWLNKPNHVIARPVVKASSKSGGLSLVSVWRAETGTCTFPGKMADTMLVGIVLGGGEGRLEEIEQNFNTLSLSLSSYYESLWTIYKCGQSFRSRLTCLVVTEICEISGSQTLILHLVVRDSIEWTAPSLYSHDTIRHCTFHTVSEFGAFSCYGHNTLYKPSLFSCSKAVLVTAFV